MHTRSMGILDISGVAHHILIFLVRDTQILNRLRLLSKNGQATRFGARKMAA